MPRYIVTSGSHFEPFSYDDLVKPVVSAQEAHNAAADAYDTLNLETEAIRQYITDNPEDKWALAIYNNYRQKLNTAQENLWNNGITASTKRDLSAARAAFSEMNKVKTAIQNRQTRSREYWDARHKNPYLVTGRDPGLDGLNAYLDDDLHGQDWYQYNGQDFINTVAADAKARAKELLSDPRYESDPALKNVITRLRKTGFSNAQVDAAANIAPTLMELSAKDRSAALEVLKKNDIGTGILAESLMSNLDATGAFGKIDDGEFERLVNYGRSGLAQGVGEIDAKDFTDPDYAYKQQVALENLRYQHNLAVARAKSEPVTAPTQRVNTGTVISVRSAGYDRLQEKTKNKNKAYESGAKSLVRPDNTMSPSFTNPFTAAAEVYSTEARDKIQTSLGIDVLYPPKKKEVKSRDGSKTVVIGGAVSDKEARENGLDAKTSIAVRDKATGQLIVTITRELSEARAEALNQVASYKKSNPDFEDRVLTPKEQAELREEFGFPEKAPWSDFYEFVTATNRVGHYSTIPLATSDSSHDYVRGDLNDAMIREYGGAPKGKDGKTGKKSEYLAYKVNPDNLTYVEDGEDMGDVLGRDQNNKILRGTVTDISATLEDLARPRPYLRFQSRAKPGETYAADAAVAFGSFVRSAVTDKKRVPSASGLPFTINGKLPTTSDLVRYTMMPVFSPATIYNMSDEEQAAWADETFALLGSDPLNYPCIYIDSETIRPAMPKEIMLDSDYRTILYDGVQKAIADPLLSNIRQILATQHEQHKGNTNSKAGIDDYED